MKGEGDKLGLLRDSGDRELIARALIGEAGGEGRLGMQAVASVIRNRLLVKDDRIANAKRFGRTVAEVLEQFDAMDPKKGGPAFRTAWNLARGSTQMIEALAIVDDVFQGVAADPTRGALFYYNPETVRRAPGWAGYFAQFNDVRIGRHRFVGDVKQSLSSANDDLPSLRQQLRLRYVTTGFRG